MQNSQSIWNKLKALLFPTIPCLLALIIMCIYAQGIFPNLTLESVNLVCLFGVSLKLVPGISEHVNAKKAESFALALIVSIASLGLNLEWKFPLTLSQMSVWVVLWSGLLLTSVFCLVAVLIRLLFWGQQEWEKFRDDAQAWRNEKKNAQREHRKKLRDAKDTYKDDSTTLRRQRWKECKAYWVNRLDAWKVYRKERAEILHKCRKERLANREELQSLDQKYEVDREKARQEHKTMLAELQQKHEDQLDEARRTHEAELAKVQQEHENKLSQDQREFETQLAQEQREHKARLDRERRAYEDEKGRTGWKHYESVKEERQEKNSESTTYDREKIQIPLDSEKVSKKGENKWGENPLIDFALTGVILAIFLLILYIFPLYMTSGVATVADGWVNVAQNNMADPADPTDSTDQADDSTPRNRFEQWVQAVIYLMPSSKDADKDGAPDEKGNDILLTVLTYVLLVAIGIISLLLFCYILYAFIRKCRLGNQALPEGNDTPEKFNFLDAYAIPIALLLVSLLGLYALSSGKSGMLAISSGWGALAMSILLILILLTAFEMVRLTLEECGHPNSLLKRLLKMIFIAMLEFLAQIVFGVLKGLQIENTITSLLTMVLPEDSDGLPAYILSKLKEMFKNEINKVSGDGRSSSRTFHKRRIWKKGGP